jgi:hypothetical protein
LNALTSGGWKKTTLNEFKELTGLGITIGGFFLVGEMIGRRSIIGYNVGSAHHH